MSPLNLQIQKIQEEEKKRQEAEKRILELGNTFGLALKKLRKNAKVSQQKLAELIKVHPHSISNWENQKNVEDIVSIRIKQIVAICIALNLNPLESQQLFVLASRCLNPNNRQQFAYKIILEDFWMKPINEVNEMLEKSGYEPFYTSTEE